MTPTTDPFPPTKLFPTLARALKAELEALKSSRQRMTLSGGEYVGSFAGNFYYRFEIPEDILVGTIEHPTFKFGRANPISVTGNMITIENQYLTVALAQDFGPSLPETECSWNHAEEMQPLLDILEKADESATLAPYLFRPSDPGNRHAVSFDASATDKTMPNQLEAVRKILQNRVTMLWGPIQSGKTHVLALAAANYLKAGKKVLYVAPTNDQVDDTLFKTVTLGGQLGLTMNDLVARVDLPSLSASETIAAFSLDHQVEARRAEKRLVFQERVNLLQSYWRVKVKQILHEDFYRRVQEMREKIAEGRKQLDAVTKDLARLTGALQQHQDSSMFERLKKGLSKEEVATLQAQIVQRQNQQKRLQSFIQAVANDVTRTETNAPIPFEEIKEFNAAVKRMEELGGVQAVMKAVDEFTAVDGGALLTSRSFIATSVATAFLDPVIRGQQFDLVVVDEAHMVNLPTLAGLATLAREKMLVAGDPFQLEPESVSQNDLVRTWIQKDIFLHVAGTEELHTLFDWSDKNAQWCILLSSHFATTPKLSLFAGSVLFDDKINVFASPQAKGKIYFIDTTELRGQCRQYVGRRRILPYNDQQTKRVIECVKHALTEGGRTASEVGVMLPFGGPTLYTKLQLRMNGIRNVECGPPQGFRGRRKKVVIFDTTMAGVDHTMRPIDDRKVGEHKIARMFSTVFSTVAEDLYVLADLSHFRTVYNDRLFTKLLLLLQGEADLQQPVFSGAVRKFDDMDWKERADRFALGAKGTGAATTSEPFKGDAEYELKMKMLERQQGTKPQQTTGPRHERDIYIAVQKVLAYRTDLNLLSLYTGGDLLFGSSFMTEQAINRLPIDLCQGEKDFREIMERWNLLIYEMSGGNKTDIPVFTQKAPESRLRESIRHLKVFYSSDVGAAMEEGKQKIAGEVARIFQDLLGKPQPGNPAEWMTAYLNFLARLEAYLGWVSEQVRR